MKSVMKMYLILASFCLFTVMNAQTFPVNNPKAKICILAYDTEFKKNLTAALVHDLKLKDISVTVDTVSNGGNYIAADYDAVILLSAVQAFRPLPKTAEYIKNNRYSSNIVYFSTYALFNFPYGSLDKKKIDAITSASVTNDNKAFEEVKNKILSNTFKILNKKE